MLELLKQWTLFLAAGVELSAAVIIGAAALMATLRSARTYVLRPWNSAAIMGIRLDLGRWLSLALEFELAADILRTAVAPTWNEIGQLAAIIVIRTAVNFFLQREIDRAVQEGSGSA
ncbi:MAG TPA: DUF1622 domain-containing protein [Stenomitos sp.]